MTTFSFRMPKDTRNIPNHVGDVIEAYTGTRHNQKKYRIRKRDDVDEDLTKVSVDFAPENREPSRGGTRGAGRGTLRGAH
jgi:hypothetical protein